MSLVAVNPKDSRPLVVVEGVEKRFPARSGQFRRGKEMVHALDGVSLKVYRGEILGLVGESGSGKSTLGRLMLRAIEPDSGTVLFEDKDVFATPRGQLKILRRNMQMVFQDPFSAMDPRMKIGESIRVPLAQHSIGSKGERQQVVWDLLEQVGLPTAIADRYPHECSGGELQRAVIARAMALRPKFLICDELTSSLDASIRARILNLLLDLRQQFGLTIMIISHDLRGVRSIADRVAVMCAGRIVEVGNNDEMFDDPLHPYTRILLRASMIGTDPLESLLHSGEPTSMTDPPVGCRFRTRCPLARGACASPPPLSAVRAEHYVACFFWDERLPERDEVDKSNKPPKTVKLGGRYSPD